jgi:asparagine N-glycosylation enzyme membrane subunit Stt3
MVAALFRNETVFTVLGDAARKRGARSLIAQFVLSVVIAGSILVAAPHWWSVAFLAGWSAAYAAWGLVVRVAESREQASRSVKAVLNVIAALGTALAVAGIIGVGLAIYSGDAAGAKNRCGRHSTSKHCQAVVHPPYGSTPLPPPSSR